MPAPMLRTLIVDDEAPARKRLQRLLQPLIDDALIGETAHATDGVDALEQLDKDVFDLMLLDVRMPEVDGFDVIDRMNHDEGPAIIFTTAYDEYALRAFEANAVDYLLKPVDEDRLRQAVLRAQQQRGDRDAAEHLAGLLETLDEEAIEKSARNHPDSTEPLKRLSIEGRDRLYVIDVENVISAEVQDGINSLFVENARAADGIERHIVSFPLDSLEARLDPETFMRVHRSALVNLSKIKELIPWFSGRYKLILTGAHEVIASRARSRKLRERLQL